MADPRHHAVVVIDGETIKLTEDVSWSYTLDTDAKTISYTFGNMEAPAATVSRSTARSW